MNIQIILAYPKGIKAVSCLLINPQYHSIELSKLPSFLKSKKIQNTQMMLRQILILFLLTLSLSYQQIDSYDELMTYHQDNSQYPIIHVYHNRHFSRSPQYADFIEVVEQTQARCSDYARFVMTDCEDFREGEAFACDQMRNNKQNRMIFGYFPENKFLVYAGKRMQNPPGYRHLNHPSDVFFVEQFQAFVDEMIPNFFEELTSEEEYQEWLKVRHTPKLLFASREELQEIPMVVRKLGVHFFQRFDLGFISDLTESIVKELTITSFPRLAVLEYNYKENIYEMSEWEGNDFSNKQYFTIKEFLAPLARPSPRNDLLFHKIGVLPDRGIVTVNDGAELSKLLDQSNGWAIVSAVTGDPLQLKMFHQRFGRFFEYVHVKSGNETEALSMYDPDTQRLIPVRNGQIRFKAIGKDDFIRTMAAWVKKGYVLIGVREAYGHFCAIAQNTLFRGLSQCLIAKQDEYQAISTALKMQFNIGFACYETNENKQDKIAGRNFKSTDYQDVYYNVEYLTRLKAKQIVDDFMDDPIKKLPTSMPIADLCANRRCALLLTPSGKTDRTAYEYLREVAVNFINQFLFYEVDLACNPQLEEAAKKGSLLVYHSKSKQYLAMKAKLSKSTFEKFLKANLGGLKKLPLHSFSNEKIEARKCQAQKEQINKEEL